jgi:hypothetical protein
MCVARPDLQSGDILAVVDREKRALWTDIVLGGVIGGLIGAIAAVNFVIYVGIEGGYEATIPEVFRQSVVAGAVMVAILVGGPVVGVMIARRQRRKRTGSGSQ